PVVIICSYMCFFAPFSSLAARSGKFVYLRWWPLLPIYPILSLINNKNIKNSVDNFFKFLINNSPLVITTVLGLALIVPEIWGLNYLFQNPSAWAGIILLILVVLVSVPSIKSGLI